MRFMLVQQMVILTWLDALKPLMTLMQVREFFCPIDSKRRWGVQVSDV
jgi:hypothetical protein